MNARGLQLVVVAIGGLSASACTSNFAVYESPTAGSLARITVVNDSESQNARFATFDDGRSCTRRRHIQFSGGEAIEAGESLSISVGASQEFSMFAALERISTDDYGVEVGVTGGSPGPVITPTVTALNCNAIVTFDAERGREYRVTVSEADDTRSCSVAVTEVGTGSNLQAINIIERVARFPRDETGSFCE